jgi:hypothetical protein
MRQSRWVNEIAGAEHRANQGICMLYGRQSLRIDGCFESYFLYIMIRMADDRAPAAAFRSC